VDRAKLNRRDFNRLTAIAVCGPAAGGRAVRAQEKKDDPGSPLLQDPHVCRGLNTCKGQGAGGNNACAGQGTCATAKAHACQGQNECKGQGGCGENPGANACKGQGACAVPLADDKWAKARKAFEEKMTKAGKKAG
jgi:hypothetical protein